MSESDIPKTLLQKLVSLWSSIIDKTGGSTGNKWAVRTTTVLSGKDPSVPDAENQATITSADAVKDGTTTILCVQQLDADGNIAPSPNVMEPNNKPLINQIMKKFIILSFILTLGLNLNGQWYRENGFSSTNKDKLLIQGQKNSSVLGLRAIKPTHPYINLYNTNTAPIFKLWATDNWWGIGDSFDSTSMILSVKPDDHWFLINGTIKAENLIGAVDASTLNGKTYSQILGDIADHRNYDTVTYLQLRSLIKHSLLKPCQQYLLIDFKTVHYYFDENETITTTGDYNNDSQVEPLILIAVSVDKLSAEAYSMEYPSDKILYDWNPLNWCNDKGFSTITGAGFDTTGMVPNWKGTIYFRHDTKQNVSTWYDFRNVKFRRWAISAPTWGSAVTYSAGAYVKLAGKIYKSTIDDNLNNSPDAGLNWVECFDISVDSNWSWSTAKTGLTINPSNYINSPTFNFYRGVKNIKIGNRHSFYDDPQTSTTLNNIVFIGLNNNDGAFEGEGYYDCGNISIGDQSFNCTFIGSYFNFNTVGNNFTYNTIGNTFNFNTVGNNFTYNTIGNYFNFNTVGNNFTYNTIGNYFNSNTIGNNFSSNTIGNNFISNTVGNTFSSNTIGNYFNSNTIGNNFISNTVGNYFSYNTIGNNFSSNTIGNNFYYNTVLENISNTDFSAGTIVDDNYTKEIFKTSTGVVKIRYINGDGDWVISDSY